MNSNENQDTGNTSLLVLPDFLAAFNTINHGILLDQLEKLEMGEQYCSGFLLSSRDSFISYGGVRKVKL